MLESKLLRGNIDFVVEQLKRRNYSFDVDEFNELENQRKIIQDKDDRSLGRDSIAGTISNLADPDPQDLFEKLQKKIDFWHKDRKGEKINLDKYEEFLRKIGY